MRKIIISAVNLVEGGPLTILQECLRYLSSNLSSKFEIIALVNRKKLFPFNDIKYLEFPAAKKSWINRLYYEHYYFNRLAKQLKPFLWLSLHDITPNVKAERLAVYCHNAASFYKLPFKEAMLDPKFALFNTFYKYLYRLNIKNNDFIIVQQDWFRQELGKWYPKQKIIVSHPKSEEDMRSITKHNQTGQDVIFFYPSFPRVFKNFEVIGRAVEILRKQGRRNFQIIFTISGTENWYARYLYKRFRQLENIKFMGLQSRDKVFEIYNNTDCVIFPSKLETWGMPITEAKLFKKPLLLADLPYAHETLGGYDKVKFFTPDNAEQLSLLMSELMENKLMFDITSARDTEPPFSAGWNELFKILLN